MLTTAITAKTGSKKAMIFWFSLSLTFVASYALLALQKAFSSEYVVQDDARVYLIWMQRLLDANLFKGDLIADYFQSVTPWGYATFYKLMAAVGIPPLLVTKLLPMVLGLVATSYCFGVCLELLPIPMAGFISTLILNQSLWLHDDLVSATPRAFTSPFLLAFLYYLLRSSWMGTCAAIALMGLFYPLGVLLCAALLLLRLVTNFAAKNSDLRRDSLVCVSGLVVGLVVILPYALSQSEFGPTVSDSLARTWPEFSSKGRIAFFNDANPWRFWFQGSHSGMRLGLNPPAIAAAFLLPILYRYRDRFSLVKQISTKIIVLPQLVLVSFGLFFLAHALLFKLYLPSRYTQHSLRIVMAIAAGIAIAVMLDALRHWYSQLQGAKKFHRLLALLATALVAGIIVLYPSIFWKNNFPRSRYVVGSVPTLYEFLQKQPKDTLIASVADEGSNLPTFAQRQILVGREYSDPYHVGYYLQFRQRAKDLVKAQYSPDLAIVKNFIQTYGVDFWLLDSATFERSYVEDRWLRQFQPEASEALVTLENKVKPALAQAIAPCSVFQNQYLVLLEAKCILKLQK